MKNRILLHIGFWLAYVLYDGYLSAPLSGSSFDGLSMGERFGMTYFSQLCLLLVKVPAVYLVLYRFLPDRFDAKRSLIFGGQILLVIVLATASMQFIWYQFLFPLVYHIDAPGAASSGWVALFRWLYNALDILFLLGIATTLKLFRLRHQSLERERELTEEKLQSELRFLRAQTNPHFLFNTLNNLFHLARKESRDTPEAILKLSGLLRFMLHECSSDRVPIAKEIKVIEDYIELEKLRYNERLKLTFTVEQENVSAPIAPLLLLPLVENAFKHGASESTGQTSIEIQLKEKDHQLYFSVKNAVDQNKEMESEGIGMGNLRRQLELQYPSHELDIQKSAAYFWVQLKIDLRATESLLEDA